MMDMGGGFRCSLPSHGLASAAWPLQTLSRHVAIAAVAQWATGALWNIAAHSADARVAVSRAGVAPWLSTVLARHRESRAAANAEGLLGLLRSSQ